MTACQISTNVFGSPTSTIMHPTGARVVLHFREIFVQCLAASANPKLIFKRNNLELKIGFTDQTSAAVFTGTIRHEPWTRTSKLTR